jgi:hypothetical protein
MCAKYLLAAWILLGPLLWCSSTSFQANPNQNFTRVFAETTERDEFGPLGHRPRSKYTPLLTISINNELQGKTSLTKKPTAPSRFIVCSADLRIERSFSFGLSNKIVMFGRRKVLADYRMGKTIGQGAFSKVKVATHKGSGLKVSLDRLYAFVVVPMLNRAEWDR